MKREESSEQKEKLSSLIVGQEIALSMQKRNFLQNLGQFSDSFTNTQGLDILTAKFFVQLSSQ